MILPKSFYKGEDILSISKQLLGKKLCTNFNGQITSGIIVETEAYKAPEDKASHAFGNKLTPRTKTMFSPPGTGYVYIIYGMYHLFNVITGPEGTAHCILIRAIEPVDGLEAMKIRRGFDSVKKTLTNGPGKLSIALGIRKDYDATDLAIQEDIWIEEAWPEIPKEEILVGPRVGMSTAEECSNWPFRFRVKGNSWTSKPDRVVYS